MPIFRVADMTREACVRALTGAVRDLDGTASLEADLATKRGTIASTRNTAALAHAMEAVGFTAEPA